MKCCICENNTEPHIIYNTPLYKCYNCKGYYIDNSIIDTFILNYSNAIIKYKSNRHKEIFVDLIKISKKSHIYLNKDIECKYGCRKECNFYKFKYLNFEFRFCNFINKYYIELEDLKNFIYKTHKLSLIYYYKEIIFKNIKKLFVKR